MTFAFFAVNIFMLILGDATRIPLADESVQCVVTSPPYWGLRDYGIAPRVWGGREECEHDWRSLTKRSGGAYAEGSKKRWQHSAEDFTRDDRFLDGHPVIPAGNFCRLCSAWRGSLGLEPTPELYVEHIVAVFMEVRRVLRKDGTVWLNLGDSYANDMKWGGSTGGKHASGLHGQTSVGRQKTTSGLKPKDLCGIPWRVAFALQADGWWLRSDIIWNKPNPMPESVTDRPTRSHEYLFLLAKSERYYFDQEAVKEPSISGDPRKPYAPGQVDSRGNGHDRNGGKIRPSVLRGGFNGKIEAMADEGRNAFRAIENYRNIRSIWTIATQPFPEAHFATFPEDLVKPCILAGTSHKGCCPKCGAPWERIVESSKTFESGSGRSGNPINGKQNLTASQTNSTPDIRMGPTVATKTVGWEPGCECGIEQTRAYIVLDPFAGSGTVVKVAQDLGRIGVGLDLKPEYLAMAKKRTAQQGFGGVLHGEAKA